MSAIRRIGVLAALILVLATIAGAPPAIAGGRTAQPELLVSGLEGGSGSTIGPDGALYVTEPIAGRISRVDRRTGQVTTYADGLPPTLAAAGTGGAMDVIFHRGRAYVLVTLVGPDVGGTDVVGIYRVDGRHDVSVFADLGAFSLANPPATDFFIPTGVQYALEKTSGGFLVTDGHHNRVLKVTYSGGISELATFGNVVPTGLEVRGRQVWMAEAGPIPHLPEDGRVLTFGVRNPSPRLVAAGGRLLVDVELGQRGTLYGLSQGVWPLGNPEGSPASPDTGRLLRVDRGRFREVASGLDRPTSLEIVGGTAWVVTLDGEVWTVDLVRSHRGRR